MKKRFLALLLVLTLAVSLFPLGTAAEEKKEFLFGDVADGVWYYEAIMFCYANNILNGTSDVIFSPGTGTTREQMMVALAKLSGEDITGVEVSPFEDVLSEVWYTDYVNWAYAKKYTSGISENLFGIGKVLTRQEAVTLLYNYYKANFELQPSEVTLEGFGDSELVSDWALDAFLWAVDNSVIKGDNNSMLNPRANVKRSELAVMIRAFMENLLYGYCEHSYEVVTCELVSACSTCPLIKSVARPHRYAETNYCTEYSPCLLCDYVAPPAGHSYLKATCTNPMTCVSCGTTEGEALGHTTSNGICSRCNKDIFPTPYAKFEYYMKNAAQVDANVYYLRADVTHADGNTSKQYIKYNSSTGKTSVEITFDFAQNNHSVKTTFAFSDFSNTYSVTSEYYSGGEQLCYAKANINSTTFNKDQSIDFAAFDGDANYKATMKTLMKNSLLLSLDASNSLLSQINMSIKDLGFINFY